MLIRPHDAPEIAGAPDDVAMRRLVRAEEHGPDLSLTWVRLTRRHRRLRTERSTRVYYILDGTATFQLGETPELEVTAGDTIVIPRGTPYAFAGQMTYLVVNAPAFVEGDDVYEE